MNFNLIGEWIGWLRKDLSGVEQIKEREKGCFGKRGEL